MLFPMPKSVWDTGIGQSKVGKTQAHSAFHPASGGESAVTDISGVRSRAGPRSGFCAGRSWSGPWTGSPAGAEEVKIASISRNCPQHALTGSTSVAVPVALLRSFRGNEGADGSAFRKKLFLRLMLWTIR